MFHVRNIPVHIAVVIGVNEPTPIDANGGCVWMYVSTLFVFFHLILMLRVIGETPQNYITSSQRTHRTKLR